MNKTKKWLCKAFLKPSAAGGIFALTFTLTFMTQLNNIMNLEFYIKVTGIHNLEPDYPYVRAIAYTELEDEHLSKIVHYCDSDRKESLTLKDLAMFYAAYLDGNTKEKNGKITYTINGVEEIFVDENIISNAEQLKQYIKNILSKTFPDPCGEKEEEKNCINEKHRFCIEIIPIKNGKFDEKNKIIYPLDDSTKCGYKEAYYFLKNALIEVRFAWPTVNI